VFSKRAGVFKIQSWSIPNAFQCFHASPNAFTGNTSGFGVAFGEVRRFRAELLY
jgi:hypothetical protein